MKRLLTFAVAIALAGPAQAAPVPIAVVSVQTPGVPFGTSERIDALVAALAEDGLIASERPRIAVKKLKACGTSVAPEACARGRVRKPEPLALPVHLAVVAYPGPDGQLRLVCIGPGRSRAWRPSPQAYVDLDAALAGGPAAIPWRQRLADCLAAAAEERRL
jgi:hypothetical protein